MALKTGTIIKSITASNNIFDDSIILIAEQNEKGYVGFMLNKPYSSALNELAEYRHSKALQLFEGGPVDIDHLFFIHRRADLIEGGNFIYDTIFLGGDFEKTIFYANEEMINDNDIKIFIGYCGWDANQLEEEIANGEWTIVDMKNDDIFS